MDLAQTQTISSLKEIFSFPFREKNWEGRFLVGTALLALNFMIPVLPAIFVYGYVLQVMRQAIEGRELKLPDWDDWGRLWTDGWRVFLVGLVFLLPGLAVLCGGTGLYLTGSLTLPFLSSGDELTGAALTFFLFSFGVFFLSLFAGTLLAILGAIPLPFATAHVAADGSVGAAFRTSEWWPSLRKSWMDYFIAWVVVFGLLGVAYLVAGLAYYSIVLWCLIPLLWAPLAFYTTLVAGAVFGETYRESMGLKPQRRQVARRKSR